MTIEVKRSKKTEEEKAAAKEAKVAKKAEKERRNREKYPLYYEIKDNEEALQKEYEEAVAKYSQDLTTWPIELLIHLRAVAPYELFGITLPEETVVVEEQKDFVFDPSKGFQPTVTPEPEIIKPFSFTEAMAKIEKPKKDPAIPDGKFEMLERYIGKYFSNQRYRYEAYNDIYKLFVTRVGGTEECYIIDNGTILGGSEFAILANKVNDAVFVFADDPEAVNVLASKFYVVSDECARRNEARLFESGIIYRYIDFSNTPWINDKDVNKKELEKNLLAVIKVTARDGEAPRMRFSKFESSKRFELVSDSLTKSPLAEIDATSNLFVPGLKVSVEDNKITIYNNDILIEQYIIAVQ